MYNKLLCTSIAGVLLICALLCTSITSAHSYAATRSATRATLSAANGRTCPQTIQMGSQGEPVASLQLELNWIFGYQDVPVDGYFGATTDAAVRDFQGHFGLPVNGIVDPTTWHALGEC
jgi:peptidoglycan hydrolase-like protein with peptidoglycan-binding domain